MRTAVPFSARIAPRGRAFAFLVGVMAAPSSGAAQVLLEPQAPGPSRECSFVEGTRSLNSVTLAGGNRIANVGNPRIRCDDGVRISADSAVAFSAQNLTQLFGNVRYSDRTQVLTSNEAQYFTRLGRLQASGNVVLEDAARGTTVRNGDLVYLRVTEFRSAEEITVTVGPDGVRPTALLRMERRAPAPPAAPTPSDTTPNDAAPSDTTDTTARDTAEAVSAPVQPETTLPSAPVPTEVEANRLFLVGEGYFRATGRVVIRRDSLDAFADTATYDDIGERMLLRGGSRVVQADYDLEGVEIDVSMPGGDVSRVVARRSAVLTGSDVVLTAPKIDILMEEGSADRLVAVRLPQESGAAEVDSTLLAQPIAEAETFRLTADSLDVRAPKQVLERIFAVGRARGDSSSRDSLNVPELPGTARTDWMEGDTVIATFSPAPRDSLAAPGDSTERAYVLDELVAAGDARSLYRLEPSDSTAQPGIDKPALHYVRGSRITIRMAEGEVQDMAVDGPTRGYHLEPLQTRVRADSAAAPPDTASRPLVPADTLVVDTIPMQPTRAPMSRSRIAPPGTTPQRARHSSGREERGPHSSHPRLSPTAAGRSEP